MTRLSPGKIGVALAAVLLVAACSGEPDDAPEEPVVEQTEDAADDVEDEAPAEEPTDDAEDEDADTEAIHRTGDGVGSGWVQVGPFQYPLTGGECRFEGTGGDVGDLMAAGVTATVDVDSEGNDEGVDIAMRADSTSFELVGAEDRTGTWSGIAAAGSAEQDDGTVLAEVGFMGAAEDGMTVVLASIVCLVE